MSGKRTEDHVMWSISTGTVRHGLVVVLTHSWSVMTTTMALFGWCVACGVSLYCPGDSVGQQRPCGLATLWVISLNDRCGFWDEAVVYDHSFSLRCRPLLCSSLLSSSHFSSALWESWDLTVTELAYCRKIRTGVLSSVVFLLKILNIWSDIKLQIHESTFSFLTGPD